MIVKKPPMGWNSWNTFGENVNEDMLCEMADAMVSTGLKDAGYEYLVLDDCWAEHERDANDRLVADHTKFPRGMKPVADYVHSKGLKFGMYSCAGTLTCARYPGSYEHEFIDAETFASWGVDYLKYDYCNHTPMIPGPVLYRRMGLALENCGRDILFSACSWGADETHEWIRSTGAGMWRSTGDIFDNWKSIRGLLEQQEKLHPFGGAGCFNDMDMLVVGMYGKGNVGLSGCNDVQYRTHFALWCFLQSPLMIGCDIRSMTDATLKTLTDAELIRLNQDPRFAQPYRIGQWAGFTDDMYIYVRHLAGGEIALGLFNMSDHTCRAQLNTEEMGLPLSTGKTLRMKNLETGEEIQPQNGAVGRDISPFACEIYRCRIVDR